MYVIIRQKSFEKSFKRLKNSGRKADIIKLQEIVKLLELGRRLPISCLDHELVGDLTGTRECHVRGDLLLMYKRYDDVLILILVDVGSHHELLGS
ncbi:MAG TPA: type II toxin-antitoxin system YafQ family toxin [Candidatus Paceibacterota bacterium]